MLDRPIFDLNKFCPYPICDPEVQIFQRNFWQRSQVNLGVVQLDWMPVVFAHKEKPGDTVSCDQHQKIIKSSLNVPEHYTAPEKSDDAVFFLCCKD